MSDKWVKTEFKVKEDITERGDEIGIGSFRVEDWSRNCDRYWDFLNEEADGEDITFEYYSRHSTDYRYLHGIVSFFEELFEESDSIIDWAFDDKSGTIRVGNLSYDDALVIKIFMKREMVVNPSMWKVYPNED